MVVQYLQGTIAYLKRIILVRVSSVTFYTIILYIYVCVCVCVYLMVLVDRITFVCSLMW